MIKLNKYIIYKIKCYLSYLDEGKVNCLSKKINCKFPWKITHNNFTLVKSGTVSSDFRSDNSGKYSRLIHIMFILKDKNIPKRVKMMLIAMLIEIQDIYEIVKPVERRSFLSYDYCMIQFLHILNEPYYINEFRMFRSVANIIKHDEIFKKICYHKKWIWKSQFRL